MQGRKGLLTSQSKIHKKKKKQRHLPIAYKRSHWSRPSWLCHRLSDRQIISFIFFWCFSARGQVEESCYFLVKMSSATMLLLVCSPNTATFTAISKYVSFLNLETWITEKKLEMGPHLFLPRIGSKLEAEQYVSTAKLPHFTTAWVCIYHQSLPNNSKLMRQPHWEALMWQLDFPIHLAAAI